MLPPLPGDAVGDDDEHVVGAVTVAREAVLLLYRHLHFEWHAVAHLQHVATLLKLGHKLCKSYLQNQKQDNNR